MVCEKGGWGSDCVDAGVVFGFEVPAGADPKRRIGPVWDRSDNLTNCQFGGFGRGNQFVFLVPDVWKKDA